uniref:SERPIN domain-containing protein n=1 Tax=Ascaris lumbricoides TaxID=6252 RepID=A0A0M3I1M3_ASCLU
MVTSTAVTSEADVNQFRKLETLGIEDPIDSKEDVAALRQVPFGMISNPFPLATTWMEHLTETGFTTAREIF